jgi:hypothetical protein
MPPKANSLKKAIPARRRKKKKRKNTLTKIIKYYPVVMYKEVWYVHIAEYGAKSARITNAV